MNKIIYYLVCVVLCSSVYCWDGYDYDKGEYIEIEKGNLVRKHKEIEVFHYEDGCYHDEEVQGFNDNELETYDYDTGKYHYYEMD